MTAPKTLWLQFGPTGDFESVCDEPLEGHAPWVKLSDSQAAVAAAYEAAAQVAIDRKGFGSDAALVHPYDKGYVAACDAIATAIRALATPDQIAALAAARAATVTVKPLVWVSSGFEGNRKAGGLGLGYFVEHAARQFSCSVSDGRGSLFKVLYRGASEEAAKAAAQADYDARIRSAITITSGASPNHIPLPRAEVEALMEEVNAAALTIDYAYGTTDDYGEFDRKYSAFLRKTLATLQERMK